MDIQAPKTNPLTKRTRIALAGAALIAGGVAAGAVAVNATRPSIEMAPLAPIAIRSLTASDSIVTLKGQAAEVFGNKFIIADASGRALVDTGRAGEDNALVSVGQPVTVQGRFDHGFLHASFLIGSDGKVISLRPVGPPHGPGGPHDDRRPRGERGPRDDHGLRDGAPPPPPVAPSSTGAPAAAPPAPAIPAAPTK